MSQKNRNALNKDWPLLRADIERARTELEIDGNDFRELKIGEWEGVQQRIYDAFLYQRSQQTERSWLWDDFKVETYAIVCDFDPYKRLHLLVDPEELVYFFVNETVNWVTTYWYYQGKIDAIIQVIGDAIGLDEYYLASKTYNWLMGANHHAALIGVGAIIPRMKQHEKEIKTATSL